MKKEIVLSGVGGQGVMSVGEVMPQALLHEKGLNATYSVTLRLKPAGPLPRRMLS